MDVNGPKLIGFNTTNRGLFLVSFLDEFEKIVKSWSICMIKNHSDSFGVGQGKMCHRRFISLRDAKSKEFSHASPEYDIGRYSQIFEHTEYGSHAAHAPQRMDKLKPLCCTSQARFTMVYLWFPKEWEYTDRYRWPHDVATPTKPQWSDAQLHM